MQNEVDELSKQIDLLSMKRKGKITEIVSLKTELVVDDI